MSVCTLPAPVSPQLLGWCPRVKTVLFVSATHLILCRQSGQQVWNTKLLPPSPGATPVSVSWSPDGQYFALVFTDGAYTVHQVSNGRQPSSFRPDGTRVASVAWALTDALDSKSLTDYWSAEKSPRDQRASVAAMGTLDGRLKISVYGALSIGELPVSSDSSSAVYHVYVDEETKEYVAVQGSCLHVYKMSDKKSSQQVSGPKRLSQVMQWLGYSERNTARSLQAQSIARHSARAVELVADLVMSCNKLAKSLTDAHKQLHTFFQTFAEKSKSPSEALLAVALYGKTCPEGLEWIHTQHEQGFKRWYKALSQSYDYVRKLLTDDILILIEELLMVVDNLRGPQDAGFAPALQAHKLAYELIDEIVKGGQRFELQACFIEHLFREEIDRPIAVTKVTKVALSDVVGSLVESGVPSGLIDVEESKRLAELVASIQSGVNDAVQETRDELREHIELYYSVDVGENVRDLRKQSHEDGYKLILDSGSVLSVNKAGIANDAQPTPGERGAVFTGRGSEVVSFNAGERILVLPGGSKKPLAFEPVAVAAHYDGERVTVCALSEDCQHYQFVTL